MTSNQREQLAALTEIRHLMERSSRFISLSGLSGVGAGLAALAGAAAAYLYLGIQPFEGLPAKGLAAAGGQWGLSPGAFFALDAALVLLFAIGSGIYFTTRRARRRGLPIWDALTRRLLWNLAIPLLTGGLFCLALLRAGSTDLLAGSTLVFYGLALLNASKYTLQDIRYLGLTEIALGVFAVFWPAYGLELWAGGFGLMHLLYGTAMYLKYERTA